MSAVRLRLAALTFVVLFGPAAAAAFAQGRTNEPVRQRDPVPTVAAEGDFQQRDREFFVRRGRPVLRIGQDYLLRAGEMTRDTGVVFGSATIDGLVDGDLVVVFGPVRLSSTAVVNGSLVVVGGNATLASGAIVRHDLVVVGGGIEMPADFAAGGEQIVVGATAVGDRLRDLVPWLTRGLLLGRPIVPGLPWVWGIVGAFFLVYLMINLTLHEPVRACAETLARKPLSTFLVGLLVLLLTGPVSLVLAASIVGLAVVPFLLCALFIAWTIGKVGVMRAIGATLVSHDAPETRPQALRSFVFGFAIITLAYMVPLLGFIAWALVGVFGLGAAAFAFFSALRRENPPGRHRSFVWTRPAAGVAGAPPPPSASENDVAPPPVPDAASAPQSPAAASTVPQVDTDLTLLPRAEFIDRLAAFVLDVVLVVLVVRLLEWPRHDGTVFLLLLSYFVAFWTWKGTTVGGIICNLRVIRTDGAPLRFADALVRGLSSVFSLALLGLGCFWILRDPERQAWHDKTAGTYVVKVPRNWPLP